MYTQLQNIPVALTSRYTIKDWGDTIPTYHCKQLDTLLKLIAGNQVTYSQPLDFEVIGCYTRKLPG